MKKGVFFLGALGLGALLLGRLFAKAVERKGAGLSLLLENGSGAILTDTPVKVRPGESYRAVFTVENKSTEEGKPIALKAELRYQGILGELFILEDTKDLPLKASEKKSHKAAFDVPKGIEVGTLGSIRGVVYDDETGTILAEATVDLKVAAPKREMAASLTLKVKPA